MTHPRYEDRPEFKPKGMIDAFLWLFLGLVLAGAIGIVIAAIAYTQGV